MSAALTHQLSSQLDVAFPQLLDEHGAMVLTLATRLTDATTGQDITQEVFLRAYRALSAYTPERTAALKLRPWLATITRNLVRNEYRRRERKGTVELSAGQLASADDPVGTIDTHDELNRLLSTLSDPQREAVVLRHVVGMPIKEVALTMACAEGTAKSHVSRGLGHLRDLLAQGEGGAQ